MSTVLQDHADAHLALLNGGAKPAAITICDGYVPPNVVPPYALVYFSFARPNGAPANDLAGASEALVTMTTAHCVGADAIAARAVSQWVETALLDVRPSITGRSCGLIRQDSAQQPIRDESTGVLVMDAIQTYRLVTAP